MEQIKRRGGAYIGTIPKKRFPQLLLNMDICVVLFIILNLFIKKPRPMGSVSGLFLIGYGIFRFLVEYVREPDANVTSAADLLTRGQWLCVPMIVGGALIMWWAYRRQTDTVKSAVKKG